MKKKERIFILVVIAFAAGGFLIKQMFFGKEGLKARVAQPGGIITEVSLNKNQVLDFDDGYGGTNTIEVKDGVLAVTQANCPDLICVYSQPISRTGEVIACLPHGMVITVMEPER